MKKKLVYQEPNLHVKPSSKMYCQDGSAATATVNTETEEYYGSQAVADAAFIQAACINGNGDSLDGLLGMDFGCDYTRVSGTGSACYSGSGV